MKTFHKAFLAKGQLHLAISGNILKESAYAVGKMVQDYLPIEYEYQ